MPGRQYTAPAVKGKPTKKRKGQKRFLNAFSIAEHQAPEKVKIRKNRLGELEDSGPKRRRDESDGSSDDEDGEPNSKKLRRGDKDRFGNEIEGGSDSEGNEWVTGHVDDDDDSSLDSDEAIGEDEEEDFEGFAFRGSSSNKNAKSWKPKRSRHGEDENSADLDEESEEEDDEQDSDQESEGFAADAVDLAAVLDQRDSESEDEGETTRQPRSGRDHTGESSDSEQDMGHDYADEFQSDGEDDQDEEKLNALKDLVSALNPAKDTTPKDRLGDAQEAAAPSKFGINPTQKLSIADLLPTVTDLKLRKSLKSIVKEAKARTGGKSQKLEVPLAKRQQDKIDRGLAFEKSKEALSRWIDTVKHNRRAEHLQFPLMDPDALSARNTKKLQPTTMAKPMNDLEATIQNILVESGMTPANGKSEEDQLQEFEELATNKMPIEEARERRAELRKARELLFREEIKAKRVKKIKSKAYRRVHRKQRERNMLREQEALADAGIGPDEDEVERMHRERAEARMSTKHRDSKWAKAMKETGRGAWDEDAREGMQDLARREEELKRRIEGRDAHDSDSLGADTSSSGSDGSDDEDDNHFTDRMRQEIKALAEGDAAPRGLAALKFMQNAEKAQKTRNEEDLARLDRELRGEESPQEEESETEAPGRRTYGLDPDAAKKPQKKERNEFEESPASDEEAMEGTNMEDSSKSPRVIETAKNKPKLRTNLNSSTVKQNLITPEESLPPSVDDPWTRTEHSEKLQKEADKWTKPAKSRRGPISDAVTISGTAAPMPPSTSKQPPNGPKLSKSNPQKKKSKKPSSTLQIIDDSDSTSPSDTEPAAAVDATTNAALRAQAFASDEVLTASSFAQEKAALAESEAPQEDLPGSTGLPGWGSWGGAGLSRREKKNSAVQAQRARAYLRATGQTRTSDGVEGAKRRDRNLDKVVVSEKRVPKNVRYLAGELPFEFETRAQYERSLRMPVGPEWSTKEIVQERTKPRVLVKGGVIGPLRKPVL